LSMVKQRITADLVPWKHGGIDVSVPLPFNGSGEGLLNHLYSKGVAKYLEDTCLKKLDCGCLLLLVSPRLALAWQLKTATSCLLEAVIRNQKHNQNVHQYILELALYVLHRFKESHEDCRKFVEQIQTDNFRMNTGMVDTAPLIIWLL
jgi:hypothetical protein